MTHEDFTSLELDDVLPKILGFCQTQTKAGAVHWISTYGLSRVRDSSDDNWQWAFTAADVIGKHMWSQPASDSFQLFQLWRSVVALYPANWKGSLPAHRFDTPHVRLIYPVYFESNLIGIMALDRPRSASSVQVIADFKKGLDLAARYLYFAYQYLEAKNKSYLDDLTGLYNQRYLPMLLDHEVIRSKRENTPFTLLFLDLDYFKMVNDGRGHWVGSKLLIEVGKVLKDQVRACDYCFRYGGDEFIVVLGKTNIEASKLVAERIRKAIESKTFHVEGHTLNLTVSIGLAAYPDHAQSSAGLIQIADQAMYYGKRKSRNIVFVAS